MKDIEFPIFKTKTDEGKKFDLTSFEGRKEYFEYKAGDDIRKLREYLKDKTFIAYLLGKKSSGKGTYSKMFKEVVFPEKIEHFSIGDMIRDFDKVIADPIKKEELVSFLKENYRGFLSLEEIMASLENRSTKSLLPSELILALVKKEIVKRGKKAIFVDGFPRDLDQISYSLFFRDLVDYREDPDVFVLIDVPEPVIDERVKHRVVCPLCQTSRSLKLLPTKEIKYDKDTKEFSLICDNPSCEGAKMVTKEGDELGIEPIRKRLETDEILIKRAFSLYGIPKVLLRNSIPADKVEEYTDDYEVTPEFVYNWNEEKGEVEVTEKPWEVPNDEGVTSNSLMPPPVVVSMIKQMVEVLGL